MMLANERMRTMLVLEAVLESRVRCVDLLLPKPFLFGRTRWREIRRGARARLAGEYRQWAYAVLDAEDLDALDRWIRSFKPAAADKAARLAIEETRAFVRVS